MSRSVVQANGVENSQSLACAVSKVGSAAPTTCPEGHPARHQRSADQAQTGHLGSGRGQLAVGKLPVLLAAPRVAVSVVAPAAVSVATLVAVSVAVVPVVVSVVAVPVVAVAVVAAVITVVGAVDRACAVDRDRDRGD